MVRLHLPAEPRLSATWRDRDPCRSSEATGRRAGEAVLGCLRPLPWISYLEALTSAQLEGRFPWPISSAKPPRATVGSFTSIRRRVTMSESTISTLWHWRSRVTVTRRRSTPTGPSSSSTTPESSRTSALSPCRRTHKSAKSPLQSTARGFLFHFSLSS